MLAQGANGSVELLNNHIVIRRKGFANVLTQGLQGDKAVLLSSITAVQFRPAGSVMAGLIQFTLVGGGESAGGMIEATKDENAVLFSKPQEPAFVAMRDAIQSAISRSDYPAQSSAPATELAKLAELFEKGHLTREEFDKAKSQVLFLHNSGAVPLDPATSSPLSPPVAEYQTTRLGPFGTGCLLAVGLVVLFAIMGSMTAPEWGEPGYRPKISDKCRVAWASGRVDGEEYIRGLCTPEEQYEIKGYRPEASD